ncbi:hypothetical protein PAHAL_1G121100 [Panicum hallii]|jgi:hypothetical protein|uniref:Uncharacterized protein n=1 Tax=Panicum hallii TaxID=206008 RepID=A0A2S3GNU8_9POAL|nr:uncharacterized protein LOC112903174 [Panicum hallii]PAN05197.1 hypothetical protein PAHAL_1G121100 [Panicum hallii]
MGNCIQQGGSSAFAGEGSPAERSGRRSRTSGGDGEEDHGASAAAPSSVVKVKVVMNKGELGWLVARLKAGDGCLEDVLREVARKREGRGAGGDGWRPSLESIVECPAETAEEAAAGADD